MGMASDGVSAWKQVMANEPLTLDDLIAFNDELAALVRAGVPLERNLALVGRELHGRLGRAMRRVEQRLAAGDTLAAAVANERTQFPPVYCEVIEAGLRSGRLSAALESLTQFARHLADLRRAIASACIYPLLVFIVGYGLLLGLALIVAPRMLDTYAAMRIPGGLEVFMLDWLGRTVWLWGAVPPVLLLVALFEWRRATRAVSLHSGLAIPLRWVPRVRRMLLSFRLATFADVLGLMVEQGVGLAAALRLASQSAGDRGLVAAADQIARAIDRGDDLLAATRACPGMPALIAWTIAASPPDRLGRHLRQTAKLHRERAIWHAEMVRILLPVFLLLGIAGTTVCLYAVAVFGPILRLMSEAGMR